jgi:hypothetical protein
LKTLVDGEKRVPNGQFVVAINSHCVILSLTSLVLRPCPLSLLSSRVILFHPCCYHHCCRLLIVACCMILLSRIVLFFVLHNMRPRHHLLHLSLVVHHRRFVISFYLMNVCPASND